MLDRLFADKRILTFVIAMWTIFFTLVFGYVLYIDNSPFMHFGPNKDTMLMGVPIDSWSTWSVVALYTFLSSCFADFVSDAIGPFITNTIQDHKNVNIPYTKTTCLVIVQTFTIYAVLMSVISLFVALTQIDFLVIRISADLLVNWYTTHKFLENKQTNKTAYEHYIKHGYQIEKETEAHRPHFDHESNKLELEEDKIELTTFQRQKDMQSPVVIPALVTLTMSTCAEHTES